MTNIRLKDMPMLRVFNPLSWCVRISRGIRVLTVLIGLVIISPSVAEAQIDSSTQKQQPVKDPDQPNMDGLVEVSFKVDETGRIQILHINSTSTQLTEYVVKKLTKIKLDTESGSAGKVITYRFVFKKQA